MKSKSNLPVLIKEFLKLQGLYLLNEYTWEKKKITYPSDGFVRGDIDSGMANYKIITTEGHILIEVGKEFKTIRIIENTLSNDF